MRTTSVLAAAAAVLVLGGCTLSAGDEEGRPTPAPDAPSQVAEPTSGASEDEAEAEGPSPEELSAEVIEAAAAPPGAPLASQTVVLSEGVGAGDAAPEVRVDVLDLRRTPDATLLTFQLSSPQDGLLLGPEPLSTGASYNTEFWTRFALEDTGAGTRYLPLSWFRPSDGDLDQPVPEGPPNSCVCPYRGGTQLSPEPVVFDVMYGPLPEGVTTVSLTAPDGVLLPDLAVRPADG